MLSRTNPSTAGQLAGFRRENCSINPYTVRPKAGFKPRPLRMDSILAPVVKRMRERFRLREITVVADRGMVSQATLEAFEQSDPPVRYIVGVTDAPAEGS